MKSEIALSLGLAIIAVHAPARAQQPAQPAQQLPPVITHAVGQDVKIRGLIVSRRGDDMEVREGSGAGHLVTITENTTVSRPAGMFKADKKYFDQTVLLPGLGVTVEGSGGDRGNIVARKVSFAKEALKVAQQINAATETLREQADRTERQSAVNKENIAANRDSIQQANLRVRDSLARMNQRVASLDQYDVKFREVVNFATGSAVLSDEAKRTLDALVAKGSGLDGYLIEVTGYADTTGTTPVNQELSQRRAEAVVGYLTEARNVPPRRILYPAGLGSSRAVASNMSAQGRSMNRRAEIRVLINRGINANGGPR